MSDDRWADIDVLLERSLLGEPDRDLARVLRESERAGLPAIQVSPLQGRLLQMLVRLVGARSVLEVGTLGGYSAIWLARGLVPGGRLVTLERDARAAAVARDNLAAAGLADVVDVREGLARDSLTRLGSEGATPFDLVFIDADKASTADYFDWAVAHTRSGGLVVVDNVVRRGAVLDAASDDENVQGVRRFLTAAGRDPRVEVTALQTVGSKGHDGFALAAVR